MKTFPIKVGKGKGALEIDAATLLSGRMLIQGTSNSGKSYLLRVIAEQTIGNLQTIIIDADGEFLSLREKCDVILAGKDGDVPVEIRSAKLLARRIAETGASTVVDMSDLKLDDRRQFVQIFLDTLDSLPRKLWGPRIIAIDEAHKLAPESGKGKAISSDAVITLMSQGRKRGHCGILLTQRLSKLKKDAAAECANVFIGKTSPIDLHSAQDMLGVLKEDREALRSLGPGEFFATGPALSDTDVVRFQARRSITTHPEPGSRYQMKAPPSRKAIDKILPAFDELPPDREEEEAERLEDAKSEIRELKREIHRLSKADPADLRIAEGKIRELGSALEGMKAAVGKVVEDLYEIVETLNDLSAPEAVSAELPKQKPRNSTRKPQRSGMSGMDRMLRALATHRVLTRTTLGHLAHLSPTSGTFSNYLSKGRVSGLWEVRGSEIEITGDGLREALEAGGPAEIGDPLEYWCSHLTGAASDMLREIVQAGDAGVGRDELARAVGLSPSSGTFSNYLSKLRKLQLITRKPPFVAAPSFLE